MHAKNELSRMTIDIPKKDHKRLKALAAALGKSMRELVIDSIEEHITHLRIPNQKTLKALERSKQPKNLIKAKNAEDLFKKLGI